MSENGNKFLGLTKPQFRGVIAGLVVASMLMQGWTLRQTYALAAQGDEAHAALCVLKRDKQHQLVVTKAYIASDTNGSILGIPRSAWVQSERDLQSTVDSLSIVHC